MPDLVLPVLGFGGYLVYPDLVTENVTFDQVTTVYSYLVDLLPFGTAHPRRANPIVPNTGDIYEED